MGCDIHFFIEYKTKGHRGDWFSFGGKINAGRHYGVFAYLADVRNYTNITPIDQPRGMPDDYGSGVNNSYHYYVVADGVIAGAREVCRSDAENWVESGDSQWTSERKSFVTDPDSHSHSWLTQEEFETLFSYEIDGEGKFTDIEEYKACNAAMKSLKSNGYDVRCVFYFDN